jgi:hypothetical protein
MCILQSVSPGKAAAIAVQQLRTVQLGGAQMTHRVRYLACSAQNVLKPPAQWLTCLLRSVRPDLDAKWDSLFFSVPNMPDLVDVHCPPWYASRSAEVVDIVRRFNLSATTEEEFVAGGGWPGYDVVRLYTNINTQDLK